MLVKDFFPKFIMCLNQVFNSSSKKSMRHIQRTKKKSNHNFPPKIFPQMDAIMHILVENYLSFQ